MIRVVLVLLAVALGGLVVTASGVVRLRASSGHWPITTEVLSFAMRRSVATWSAGIEVPPLDDPDQVVLAAGHYEDGCRPCHGIPDAWRPAFAHQMTPPPPDLSTGLPSWDDEDLFYVVKHGVKFTGMPGWPDLDRDDEVWAMVAFLRRLPSLDRAGYDQLVSGGIDPAEVPAEVRPCARCHGTDGLGRGAFPRLAGQREEYLAASVRAYAARDRSSGIMQVAADELPGDRIDDAARWFAALPPGPPWPVPPNADLARGAAIARGEAGVPGCDQCHGPSDHPRNPQYPLLTGQDPEFLAEQLRLFRTGTRGGTRFSQLMEGVVAHGLADDQIRDVTAWYAAGAP